jgi:hypothetical protein
MSDPQTDTYNLAGILLRFLVRDPAAGYCLVESLVAPGAGPPPNRHTADDEAFYILDGTLSLALVPRSGLPQQANSSRSHAVRCIPSATSARLLLEH